MDVSYNPVSVFNSPTTNIFAKFSNNGTYKSIRSIYSGHVSRSWLSGSAEREHYISRMGVADC